MTGKELNKILVNGSNRVMCMSKNILRGDGNKLGLFLRNGVKIVALLSVLAMPPVCAQTDFNIKSDSSDLKAEFQKELDAWMLRAYSGDRDAQFKVGVLFSNDQFNQPDHEQSAHWYTQAARQGHVLAQYNLGHLYLLGSGVKRDENEAMRWWLKAAEQQHALSQFNIGRAYYLGIGLEKDLALSRLWFERAAQNNEPKSIEILKQLGWWKQDTTTATASTELAANSTSNSSNNSDSAAPVNTATNTPTNDDAQTPPTTSNDINSNANAADDGQSISVFTNPATRSVLVSILDNANDLVVVKETEAWTIVRSKNGLPVWVHKNFIRVSGSNGIITGNSVNARSVPLITKGSIVGRLNKNEPVIVIDQRDEWYRVVAPTRFKVWVKTSDLKRSKEAAKRPKPAQPTNTAVASNPVKNKFNDNDWLYDQEKSSYTLQLASFDDPTLVSEFVDRLPFKESNDLRLYTTINEDGKEWTYVLYGSLENEELAKQTREELKQKRAWIRRFGVLQQNRCLAWKRELPAPKELNEYCLR